MRQIVIGDKTLKIKDYFCSDDDQYFSKEESRLWLYVNICKQCQASCPFCVNPGEKGGKDSFSTEEFKRVLFQIKDNIYGISITGGEPLLFPERVDEIIDIIREVIPEGIEIDLVTNGVNLACALKLRNLSYLDSIHISRHAIKDEDNQQLMAARTPSISEIAMVASQMKDPGKLVFNCVLQKGQVDSIDKVKAYLEMAAMARVRNNSFIGMFLANDYCRENYVGPHFLNFNSGEGFQIWNHRHDYDFCSCSTGSYRAKAGLVNFYYRCPGNKSADYARQLVYTADNNLLAGFAGEKINFIPQV